MLAICQSRSEISELCARTDAALGKFEDSAVLLDEFERKFRERCRVLRGYELDSQRAAAVYERSRATAFQAIMEEPGVLSSTDQMRAEAYIRWTQDEAYFANRQYANYSQLPVVEQGSADV